MLLAFDSYFLITDCILPRFKAASKLNIKNAEKGHKCVLVHLCYCIVPSSLFSILIVVRNKTWRVRKRLEFLSLWMHNGAEGEVGMSTAFLERWTAWLNRSGSEMEGFCVYTCECVYNKTGSVSQRMFYSSGMSWRRRGWWQEARFGWCRSIMIGGSLSVQIHYESCKRCCIAANSDLIR